jgi:flagellar biosynthesis protein FlhA
MLGIAVICVVMMLIVPMPGMILDSLIAVSLTIGLMILLTSMSVGSPADFSVFPTLLLATTVFRLALNVSTTRMILTKGSDADSYIIEAFSSFVLGGGTGQGRLVLGLIIYLILILVQIMVITKGATRISEVAARFTLDALPGKQLSVDNELSANLITEEEARAKRKKIDDEANFYGAMDGASKFVQGDVRVGLIITAINMIGGFIVGMAIHGDKFNEALNIYISFTIGDGLVSQIPALLITTATGMIVTRAVGEKDMPTEIKEQLLQNPNILWVVGGSLIASSLVPGFPTLTLIIIGSMIVTLAYVVQTKQTKEKEMEKISKEEIDTGPRKPADYVGYVKVDPLEIELGYSLTPLVNPKRGGTLLEQIANLREKFASEMGLIVPPIRIRDNMELAPELYVIKVLGTQVAMGEIQAEKLMAMDTGKATDEIDGTKFTEPTYKKPAIWIDLDKRQEAEMKGYSVVAPETILITHLTEIINSHASELLGRQQVQLII